MTITVNNASLFFKDHSGNVGKVKSFTDNDVAKIATAIETVGTHTAQLANLDAKVTTNTGNITTNTTDIAALSSRVDKIVDGSGNLTKATTAAYGTVVLATEADVKAGTAGKVVTADVLSAVGPTSDCVTLSGEQTITGAKTFSIITKSATPSASASGTEVVTAAWARARLAELLPAGTIVPFAGANIPSGFLLCNGSAVSRTLYADLFSAIGTVWGTGDGSTTFNLPDARDRFLEGAGSNSLGAYLEAGLPNITGVIHATAIGVLDNSQATPWIDGALASATFSSSQKSYATIATTSSTVSQVVSDANFYANRSSAVYSKSNTVQPKAFVNQYLIKY